MDARETRSLPAQLDKVRRRFERWRATRKGRSPIPDGLWASAVRWPTGGDVTNRGRAAGQFQQAEETAPYPRNGRGWRSESGRQDPLYRPDSFRHQRFV